jgi:vacuolar protein sorting-associated protein 41
LSYRSKDPKLSYETFIWRKAMGTHNGIVHVFDFTGTRVKSYRPHAASILDLSMDATGDFVATASVDGQNT